MTQLWSRSYFVVIRGRGCKWTKVAVFLTLWPLSSYQNAGPRRKARKLVSKNYNFTQVVHKLFENKSSKKCTIWNSLGICSKSCCISRMTWRLLNRPRHRWQFVCRERPRGQAWAVQRPYTKSVLNLSLIINYTMMFQTRWQMKVECFPQLSNLWWMQNSVSKLAFHLFCWSRLILVFFRLASLTIADLKCRQVGYKDNSNKFEVL